MSSAPVDLDQVEINLSGDIGGEHEAALEAIVAALGDGLPWLLGATAVGASREEATEASDVALGVEPLGVRREVAAHHLARIMHHGWRA